ncbi:MAG: ParB/RepB/Spo0J family partition protein [bacterium]|nr:ParB/RepB/Spo0J family partition protein [bacterium]
MSNNPKQRLGKGLEALIPRNLVSAAKTISEIPLSDIQPNPFQPRKTFDQGAIDSLCESIKQHGIQQPIVVRKINGGIQLVAGERRWRAAQKAGLASIPAIIRTLNDQQALQIAIIENLERQDLNPVEMALGYKNMIDTFDVSHEDIAKIFTRSRSSVTNTLRLLNLPDNIQEMIRTGQISEGHARALLRLEDAEDQHKLIDKIVKDNWSVRNTEDAARSMSITGSKKKPERFQELPQLLKLEEYLTSKYSAKVRIKGNGRMGRVEIHYGSAEELAKIVNRLQDQLQKSQPS